MKKIVTGLFAVILAFGFTACSDPEQEDPKYSLTIGTSQNGSVTASKTSGIKAGEIITLTASPEGGYELASFSVRGESVLFSGEGNTRTFAMPKRDLNLTAVFRLPVQGKLGRFSIPYYSGDIVFNDGSAIPYAQGLSLTDEQKDGAIAIIFYSGNELNSGEDTATVRTLGVGLKHNRTGLPWCTLAAQAYGGMISAIQCPESGSSGALPFTGDKNGSDNLEQIAAYLTAQPIKTDDTATPEKYPAFYFAKNYSSAASNLGNTYKDGWFLPSIAEIYEIYVQGKGADRLFDIDAALELCGGDKFEKSVYWSSSLCTSYTGGSYIISFTGGGCSIYSSDCPDFYACSVREF